MATKTTGAEFKRFYHDPEFWPEDKEIWHEDEIITVNGEELSEDFDLATIPDDAKLTIEYGLVYGLDGEEPSFETYFKRWRKKQTTTSLVVECDIAKVDAVKAAIKAAGGRVV